MRTRVLVDALAAKPQAGGLRTYAVELVRALVEQDVLEVTVVTSHGAMYPFPNLDIAEQPSRLMQFPARVAWRETHLPRLVRRARAEALLSLAPELPLRPVEIPAVAVVHDIGPLSHPATYPASKRARFRVLLPLLVRRADTLVCPTRAVLDELCGYYPAARQKATVIHEGPRLIPSGDGQPHRRNFALHVGSVMPHKNVVTLLRALALLPAALDDFKLVFVGPLSRADRRMIQVHARAHDVSNRVVVHGWAGDAELSRLYGEARLLLFPSLHEGFGLPLVEALSFGLPVVASDIPAFREIAGAACTFVSSPIDAAEWARAICVELAQGPVSDLVARTARGQADLFSWSRAARSFAEVLGAPQ